MKADESSQEVERLLEQAAAGNTDAAGELFRRYSERLKRMLRLRLNPRLAGRLDESDVLQEAFVEATRSLDTYLWTRPMPFYLWLRRLTLQKLAAAHRRHLEAQGRDVRREQGEPAEAWTASSVSLADLLVGHLTSPSQAAVRAELRQALEQALEKMNELDREVLILRHFEQLSNVETAQVLGIDQSAASKRYLRALERLHDILVEMRIWGEHGGP